MIVSDLAHDIRYQQTRNLRSNVNASGWNEKLLRQNSGREEGFFFLMPEQHRDGT